MPAHPSAHSKGWQFSFPTQNGVHYLVHPYSGQFNGVAATFRIEQNGTFVEVEPCVGSKPAARLYFDCRRAGVTLRSSVDCTIAQIALEHGAALLHNDRDFERIAKIVPQLKLV